MNEQDGHAMLVARAKALEAIALRYMELFSLETSTGPNDQSFKGFLEKEVERLAPGCSHKVN